MRRIAWLAVVLTVLLPGAAAAGGGGGFGSCSGFGEGSTVSMRDSCFEATAHFAPEGTVTVVNDGGIAHTYTAVDGSFDSGTLNAGDTAEIDPGPGIHRVYCSLHSTAEGEGMAGVLIVEDPALAAAALDAGSSRLTVVVLAGALLAVLAGALGLRRRFARR